MAFAIAAAGVKIRPLTQESNFRDKFVQLVQINLTAAATDTALTLSSVTATDTADGLARTDLLNGVDSILHYKFLESMQAEIAEKVVGITSSAGAGGAATEAMTVTGLLTGDTVLSVAQKTKGANSLPLLGWSTQAANAITGIWSADPGAGAVIQVTALRKSTAHTFNNSATAPVWTFGGVATPTTLTLYMLCVMKAGHAPILYGIT